MDWRKVLEYLGSLTSNSILPSFRGFFSASSKEISDSIKKVEKAIVEDREVTIEAIKDDMKEGFDKVRKAKLGGEAAKFLNKMEFVKGDPGKTPTEEELVSLIKPLIPEPVPGKPGKNYVLTVKDKKEIAKSIDVPVVEKVVETIIEKQPIVTNEIVEVAVADKPKDIVKKLSSLEGEDRLSVDAIKGMEKWKANGTKLFGKAVKSLSALSDVNISSPTDNQSLTYDSATGKWVNETVAGGSGDVATDAIWDAKGDLAVGTGANTASRLGVGANNTVLTADSAEATGVKWAVVAGTGDVVGPASATDNAIARYNLTTGKLIQNSSAVITDNGYFEATCTTTGTWNKPFKSLITDLAADQNAQFVFGRSEGANLAAEFNFYNKTSSSDNIIGFGFYGVDQILNIYPDRTVKVSSHLSPISNDGAQLGTTALKFSDLFLASGGVINFNSGNATITHSAGLLTSNVDIAVPDEVYDATAWNGSLEVPTKNAVRDKIEAMLGSSGITRTVVVTSGSATMGSSASTDYVYFVAGAHTMSLPAAAANTNRYTVKNNHSAAITIDTAGAETVEGAASISIAPEESVDILSNGTNWFVV